MHRDHKLLPFHVSFLFKKWSSETQELESKYPSKWVDAVIIRFDEPFIGMRFDQRIISEGARTIKTITDVEVKILDI